MDVMKGRYCYAAFFDEPGLEKLFNNVQVKASFLRPVTLSFSLREPFRLRAAAGLLACPSDMVKQSWPAAAFFFSVLIVGSGRFRFYSWTAKILTRAGHLYF